MQQMQEFSIHTHTKIGDGYDTVEDMILEAKRSGLKTLGISDHFWAVSYDLPNYVKTIRAAQDKLQFDVLIGLEIDNPSDDRLEMLYKIKKEYGFDYFIGSLHDVPYNGKKYYVGSKEDKNILQSQTYQQTYWQTLPNLANDLFDIIAHMDLIKLTGVKTEALYEADIDKALKAFKAYNQIIEINTKHHQIENEPSDTILAKVAKADIPVIFSSDAHIKHQLIQHFAEEQRRLAEPLAKMRYISKSDELRQFLQSRHGPRTK